MAPWRLCADLWCEDLLYLFSAGAGLLTERPKGRQLRVLVHLCRFRVVLEQRNEVERRRLTDLGHPQLIESTSAFHELIVAALHVDTVVSGHLGYGGGDV